MHVLVIGKFNKQLFFFNLGVSETSTLKFGAYLIQNYTRLNCILTQLKKKNVANSIEMNGK